MTSTRQSVSPGKLWGMRRLADEHGFWKMVAIDQRTPMFGPIAAKRGTATAPTEDVVRVKRLLARHLTAQSSALLMDPHLAYPDSIGELPAHRGLILSHEHSETENTAGGRKSVPIPGWSVAKARRIGADAVKVLVWYRADAAPDVCAHQEAFVRAAAEECAKHDIVMLLEVLVYPLPGEDPATLAPRRTQLVIDSIRPFCDPALGIDIYKLEPPGPIHGVPASDSKDAATLQQAYDQMAAMVPGPWVMLSAGAGADDFEQSLHYAYRAGAAGYLAGRAIWSEAFDAFPDYDKLEALLKTRSRDILDRLNALTDAKAARWHDHRFFGGQHPVPAVELGEFPRTYG
ncbi:MAG: tagatose 1,6-diphosphate aldolase [Hyphomicrobiales bacterium]|jgi:tagatose 1,6-diphosphate aldolase|nr:tagatose 1,6-diphosphate aldolase [Hyphomicrobiales bacterium]